MGSWSSGLQKASDKPEVAKADRSEDVGPEPLERMERLEHTESILSLHSLDDGRSD